MSSVFYRRPPRRQYPEIVRGEGAYYASGGQDGGAGDLLLVGPPFTIERGQIDEAVSALGDAISAVTRP